MNGASATESEMVNTIADRYRRDGYEVLVEPDPATVPFDLGGFHPDLIVRKGGLSSIVEVKRSADRTSFDNLRPIVEETKRHAGWRFVLITGQDVVNGDKDSREDSWQMIFNSVNHARRLQDSGENEAGYLTLWIVFERAMRLHSEQVGLPLSRLSPSILIGQLYSHGELTMSQYDDAVACQDLRNRIVHGYRASDIKAGIERLQALTWEVLNQWSSSQISG